MREIERDWGAIDILVNNAGVSQNLPLALMEEEDWDHVMDVNVKGTFLTSRAVLRGMIRRKRGVVLNIGSLAGVRMIEAPVHYCASKAAIKGLTEALAKEVARYGIRVLCLAPGLLEDGVGRNLPEHRLADYLQALLARPRSARSTRSPGFAAFLVSDANSYMSGETIVDRRRRVAWTPPHPCVIVFGGSGAVGREVCRTLAARGARVGFTYFTNETVARELTAAIPTAGAATSTCVTSAPSIARLMTSPRGAVASMRSSTAPPIGITVTAPGATVHHVHGQTSTSGVGRDDRRQRQGLVLRGAPASAS